MSAGERTAGLIPTAAIRYRLLRLASRVGVPPTLSLRVGRSRRRIPLAGGAGLAHCTVTEPWMEDVIRALRPLRPGAFLDVGAHLGETLLSFLAAGGTGSYLAVEPSPVSAAYIDALCRANGVSSVTIVPCALAAAAGLVLLQGQGPLDSSASIVPDFRPEQVSLPVQPVVALPGDQVLVGLGVERVGVIKIDVEGAELDVLRGLAATIARDRPAIICEVLPIYDATSERGARRRARCDAMVAFTRAQEYAILRIRHEGGYELLEDIPTHGEMGLVDYIFVPAELARHFAPAHLRAADSGRAP